MADRTGLGPWAAHNVWKWEPGSDVCLPAPLVEIQALTNLKRSQGHDRIWSWLWGLRCGLCERKDNRDGGFQEHLRTWLLELHNYTLQIKENDVNALRVFLSRC